MGTLRHMMCDDSCACFFAVRVAPMHVLLELPMLRDKVESSRCTFVEFGRPLIMMLLQLKEPLATLRGWSK